MMKFKLLFKNAFSTDNVHLHDTVRKCYVQSQYRSGTVNSKSFVGKVLLRIKWKFELTYAL